MRSILIAGLIVAIASYCSAAWFQGAAPIAKRNTEISGDNEEIPPYLEILRGRDGRDGHDGAPGPRGPPGRDCCSSKGNCLPGEPGKNGTDGMDGLPGEKGDPGIPGVSGMPGMKGTPGLPGVDGLPGPKGDPGITGMNGSKGDRGNPGAMGYPGIPGIDGENGTDGLPGPKGDKGDRGDPGLDGAMGIKGDPGLPGLNGTMGDTGHPGINGTDGAKGEKGDRGEKGDIGDPGINGTRGEKGDPGIPGLDGLDGAPGAKGEIGLPGANGTKGEIGLPGVDGAKGEKGDPGLPGLNGADGMDGPKGDTGMPGAVSGGATYIRWGRTTCPNILGTELVYTGIAAGSKSTTNGGGVDYQCIPNEVESYSDFGSGNAADAAYLYGVIYRSTDNLPNVTQSVNERNVPCAVCYVGSRGTVLTIPGKTTCPTSWTTEYYGFLMAELSGSNHYRSTYECVDGNPEDGGEGDILNSASFYHVEVRCSGSIQCPPFNEEQEIPCVVCSR